MAWASRRNIYFRVLPLIFWGFSFWIGGGFSLSALPRLLAKPKYLDLLRRKQDLNWETLFQFSLEASGVPAEAHGFYRTKLNRYIADLTKLLQPLNDDYEKGEEILRYIFRFLSSYEALQTRTDVMFNDGTYNCVSSAILYVSLARALGFTATGVGTYDHAFVNLVLGDGRHIDVETTSKYGFDPGQKKEFIDTFTSMTGLIYVPKNKYARRSSLNDAEFVSLILQNRLYILNQSNQNFRVLEQMIPLAADLATLTQTDMDVQNFFSMVSQYSFNLSKNGNFSGALRFTDLVLDAYGDRASIVEVRNVIAYNYVFTLLEKRDYSRAKERLDHYRAAGVLSADSYKNLYRKFMGEKLQVLVNSPTVPFAEKLLFVQNVARADLFNSRKLEDLYRVIYGNEVYAHLKNGQFSSAAKLLQTYPNEFRTRPFYQNIQADLENSHVVHIYNKSVTEINKGAYRQAAQIIADGLGVYPHNERLQSLRSRLLQIQASIS